MMAGTTTRYSLPYPSPSDNNNVPADMQALAVQVDTKLGDLEDRAIDLAHLATQVQDLLVPTGSVFSTARSTAPNGYLLCDGSAVSRTTYPALFSAIGATYGAGDGSTTFNLPDLRGRVALGVGTASGANGATAHTLAQKGGEETHQLSTAEMPPHVHTHSGQSGQTHPNEAGDNNDRFQVGWGGTARNVPGTQTDAAGGSGGTVVGHNNLQPYTALNCIIKI